MVDRAWSCGSACLCTCCPGAWGRKRPQLVTTHHAYNAARARLQNHQSTASSAKPQGLGAAGPCSGRSSVGSTLGVCCSDAHTRVESRHACAQCHHKATRRAPTSSLLKSTTCTTNSSRCARYGDVITMTHSTSSIPLHRVPHAAQAQANQAQHTHHMTDGAQYRNCAFCAPAAKHLNTDVAADGQVAVWALQRSVQMAPGWGHVAGDARSMVHSNQHVQSHTAGHDGCCKSHCFVCFL